MINISITSDNPGEGATTVGIAVAKFLADLGVVVHFADDEMSDEELNRRLVVAKEHLKEVVRLTTQTNENGMHVNITSRPLTKGSPVIITTTPYA